MALGDSSNSVLYKGQWIQRSDYDRIIAQQDAAQQAQIDQARGQQAAAQQAEQQRIAMLNPANASFVKAVPGEQGRSTIIQRYYADTNQYDTIRYESASAEMKQQADQYISSHESEFWNIDQNERTGYASSIGDNKRKVLDYASKNQVAIELPQLGGAQEGSAETKAMFAKQREILYNLPDYTPVKIGDGSNVNVFAYGGGLAYLDDNDQLIFYPSYGPKVPVLNTQLKVTDTIADPIKENVSSNTPNKVVSPYAEMKGISSSQKINIFDKTTWPAGWTLPGPLEKSFFTTSTSEPETQSGGLIPSWVVGDVLALPGNTVSGFAGMALEAGSLLTTQVKYGSAAMGVKAVNDWWKWESDLGQSLKADPSRYLYNFGLGIAAGKVIGVAGGAAVKTVPKIADYTGVLDNMPKSKFPTKTPFNTAEYLPGGKLYDGVPIEKIPQVSGKITPTYDTPGVRGFVDQQGTVYRVVESNPDEIPLSNDMINRLLNTEMTTKTDTGYTIDISKFATENDMTAYLEEAGKKASAAPITIKGDLSKYMYDASPYRGQQKLLYRTKVEAAAKSSVKPLEVSKNMLKPRSRSYDALLYGAGASSSSFNINKNIHAYPKTDNSFNGFIITPKNYDANIGGSKIQPINFDGLIGGQKQPTGNVYVPPYVPVPLPKTKNEPGIIPMLGTGLMAGAMLRGSSKFFNMNGIGGGAGSFRNMLGTGKKNQKYRTGDVNKLLYGSSKKRRRKR